MPVVSREETTSGSMGVAISWPKGRIDMTRDNRDRLGENVDGRH